MKITFLGTGTSQGVPVIACNCAVCQSLDKNDKRLRSSVLIESDEKTVIIDTGPDFRFQMLRENIQKLDAVVFTHPHKDHIAGLDDIRAFNFKQKSEMAIYANLATQESLKREFYYIFSDFKYPGIPVIKFYDIDNDVFEIGDISIQPIEVMHFKMPVLGFRIKDFTYITDAKTISEVEKEKIKGTKILVLNALQKEKHISHLTFDEAVAFAQEINAEQTYFTHISHKLGTHESVSRELPASISLAFDGLTFEI